MTQVYELPVEQLPFGIHVKVVIDNEDYAEITVVNKTDEVIEASCLGVFLFQILPDKTAWFQLPLESIK